MFSGKDTFFILFEKKNYNKKNPKIERKKTMKKFPELFEMVYKGEVKIHPAFLEVLYDVNSFLLNNTEKEDAELNDDGICLLQYKKNDIVIFLHVYRSDIIPVPYYEISLYVGKDGGNSVSDSYNMQEAYQSFIACCKQYV